MKTLLLAQDTWDLVIDVNGNLAIASEPYAQAQDVASAVRTQLGDLWYDTTTGIPYTPEIFGEPVRLQFVRQQVEAAALTVPGVTAARCVFASLRDRILTGQVQVTDNSGNVNLVNF